MRSGANLHVFHIKNASLDILISYSYEELLQMDATVPGVWDQRCERVFGFI